MLKDKSRYDDMIYRLFPEVSSDGTPKHLMTFTFQVTEDCSLRCTYCYQPTKVHKYMTFDVAKVAIDQILDAAENDPDSVFAYDKIQGLIIDFIGGEPFLNIDLMLQIIEYFENELVRRNSPWLYFHKYSISTNGVAYFEPKVQYMMNTYENLLSVGVTVDGNRDLHDSCRLFPDGRGSYDYAIKAALDIRERYNQDGTKITIAPSNLVHLNDAIQNMLSMGFIYIHANCVFEDVWSPEDATTFYYVLKELADWLLETDWDQHCYIALFEERFFNQTDMNNDKNWCGGTGAMVALDCDGNYYPCVRYLPNSIGFAQKPFTIGNLKDGLYSTPKDRETRRFLESITKTSQSTKECLECPIASGCAWCSGYNYQCFGTPNKRATFICGMHKARALGNLYFWSKEAKKYNKQMTFQNCITDEIALEIIPEEEWNMLKNL